MAPGNNERHPGHTGTIPKTKARNNCNVPQEAVTPTRRDMTTNLVSTSLDWVPVSEYNSRTNYNAQSRKPSNNTSEHELTDLDNSAVFESGFGRFVPVRPQPRALPLNVQNRESTPNDHHDDGASSSISGHTLHPYAHQMQNGLNPHSNHAAAAVMIVNPTTPNTVTGHIPQPLNSSNQNRNNLTRNLNSARNHFEGNASNNNTPPSATSRSTTKTVNLMNNMFDQGQGSFNNLNENTVHRESARALGEAIVAACPDAAAVERRLGQIREYIRITSSLVDTMRNSEDEAFIEHTKEEYDELVQMVMQLKESEEKLEGVLTDTQGPENVEVPAAEPDSETFVNSPEEVTIQILEQRSKTPEKTSNIKNDVESNNLKKVSNVENEQLNKSNSAKVAEGLIIQEATANNPPATEEQAEPPHLEKIDECVEPNNDTSIIKIQEMKSTTTTELEAKKEDDTHLNELLRKNILSCVEKAALIEELKKSKSPEPNDEVEIVQDVVVRPISVQSNGSVYSENELWQNEIKNKMELSQIRLATLKHQQKKLLKYQEEAKQQLDEMHRERQSQEIHPSTSHDNFSGLQNQSFTSSNYQNRMYAANQIGVATTLPHTSESVHSQQSMAHSIENDRGNSAHSSHSNDDRYHRDANNSNNDENAVVGRDSDAEEDEGLLGERARMLQMKLRDLQMKKQHMESLVTEFQKLQMATRLGVSRNTYSSSGEESAEDDQSRNIPNNNNIKNDDPYKLMEIKAIKAALQKTKDLMRTVENYESDQMSAHHEEAFHMPAHSNIHDNKSEGGASVDRWSNDGSVCRVRNSLPLRHKFTNEQQQAHSSSHEANLASLQDLAQELRMETEKIMGERARIKELVSNKELVRKQKKVNEEIRPSANQVGVVERRQMELRAILAEKQRELEALLNKEKTITSAEASKQKSNSRAASVVNQSYASEQEEPDSRSDQILLQSHNSRETDNFRGSGDSPARQLNAVTSHLGSMYGSDSDSPSRSKSNQRNRTRRRPTQDRLPEDNPQYDGKLKPRHQIDTNLTAYITLKVPINPNPNIRLEPRPAESSNVSMVPPIAETDDHTSPMSYPHPPPGWNTTKTNQDMRTNQFTQNSHSQTMERLLGTPQMSYPPSMPFNMMMPYSVVGGCGCGCGLWGAWCWQQLALQQRDMHQLRERLHHLEERWRVETASHTLNNQVPPGNRANNYWDNFRSYSRQNLLSANSKANAESQFAVAPPHNPHPLVERSHNTLHHTSSSTSPSLTPKRNTNAASVPQNSQPLPLNNEEPPNRNPRRNVAYERSLSFSSAPDVLNVNQNLDADSTSAQLQSRYEDSAPISSNININRQDIHSNAFRNLNISNPIPEIIQSHANNLNSSANNKKKSSSKLPAKNSTNRRNFALEYSQTSNINIASTSDAPNPNLAPTTRDGHDKATSKLFDLLRENVYSEVTTLIDVNESHPDFLIQLFRELQGISSDSLRQKVLQSIRNVSSQCSPGGESQNDENLGDERRSEPVTTSSDAIYIDRDPLSHQASCMNINQIDNKIVRFLLLKSEEILTNELIDALAGHIINNIGVNRQIGLSKKQIIEYLSKYKGLRVCDVSGDIIECIPIIASSSESDETVHTSIETSESSVLQDVAGALNLFSSSDPQLHQMNHHQNACPYDMWPGHVHMDIDSAEMDENKLRHAQESKVDLINCAEMTNGDLAEADQTIPAAAGDGATAASAEAGPGAEGLPDVVDTEEVTPTEAEAEWIGLDRVPTRLHLEQSPEKQKD